MKTIALLSCVSKKCDFRCEAKNMYKSPLFIKSYNYAKSLKGLSIGKRLKWLKEHTKENIYYLNKSEPSFD